MSLIILTYLLCVALRKADQRRKRLLLRKSWSESRESSLSSSFDHKDRETSLKNKRRGSYKLIRENKKQRDSQSTTLMLIVVICCFLLTELPLLVITVLHTLDNR